MSGHGWVTPNLGGMKARCGGPALCSACARELAAAQAAGSATQGHPAAIRQEAPYPDALAYLVERTRYKEGWRFTLEELDRGQGSKGLTLVILRQGPDAYRPERNLPVNHYFIVPAASYNLRSWQRWLFDRIRDIESHEAAEFFQICDSPGSEHAVRPYAPLHGPGWDPYLVAELATDEERRTSFRGDLNPESP